MENKPTIKNSLLPSNFLYHSGKRIICAFAWMVLFSLNVFSQSNLVPNGSFEIYSSCPTSTFGEINKATPWFQPNFPYAGAGGSSDYDHFCAGYDCNSFKQCPRTGQGMAGIALFTYPYLYNKDYWREYIEVGLTDSLLQGKKYCVRFYVNMLDNSCFPVKQVQAVLTNDSILYTGINYEFIPGYAPCLQATSVIKDSINWVQLDTTYLANGGEKFITIGNFNPGSLVQYDSICATLSGSSAPGYYFFDDVSIYEQPDINAGIDTIIPPGDSIQLGVTGRPDIFYSWSPTTGLNNSNIANPMATPGTSTTYTLTVVDTNQLACTNIFYDTVTVLVGFVGIEENSICNAEGKLFPNPAQNSATFENTLPSGETGMLIMYDLTGKLLSSYKLNAGYNKLDIDLSNYSNGIYLYQIFITGEIVDHKKLAVTK